MFVYSFVIDQYGANPDIIVLLYVGVFVGLFVMDQYGADLEITALFSVFVSLIVRVQYGANLEATALLYACLCVFLLFLLLDSLTPLAYASGSQLGYLLFRVTI